VDGFCAGAASWAGARDLAGRVLDSPSTPETSIKALMELPGATVCFAEGKPAVSGLSLMAQCVAFKTGLAERKLTG